MDWVLFDCDGVLIDSEAVALGVLEERFNAALGDTVDVSGELPPMLGLHIEAMADILGDRYGAHFSPEWVEETHRRVLHALGDLAGAIPDVGWALERIDGPKAVVSNSQVEQVRHALDRTGLAHHFGGNLFAAEMVARPKPAPDLYRHAAATLGTEPSRCLVVEDSRAGVTAAVAAGMTVIGFTGGGHLPAGHAETQLALGAVASVSSMRELPAALGRVRAS